MWLTAGRTLIHEQCPFFALRVLREAAVMMARDTEDANGAECPYCGHTYSGRSTISSLNRHLKQMANKDDEARGNHPKNGTAAFEELRRQRSWREVAVSTEERKERAAERKRKWKRKQILARTGSASASGSVTREGQGEPQPLPRAELIAEKVKAALERLWYVTSTLNCWH